MTDVIKENLIMYSTALINGKSGEISLFRNKISWCYYNKFDKVFNSLLINDIISIRNNCDFSLKNRLIQSPKVINRNSENLNKLRMVIYSIVARSSMPYQWNILSTIVCFDEERQCSQWCNQINKLLQSLNFENVRPKSLAVFINPIGGSKTGVNLYNSKVKPIFDLAGIKVHVTVTEKRDEAKEYILKQQSYQFDGLVCVGGDGMLMELIHGLLLKARLDSGHSEDNHQPNSPEFPSPLRVGIIAAGSTDSVAYSTMGTRDVITSALHIVRGSNISLDALTVHSKDTFLRYNISLMGYGFFGDCVSESEAFRWMGPERYNWLGFKHFMSLTAYFGELKYLPANQSFGDPRDGSMCEEKCLRCAVTETETRNIRPENDWVVIRDRFVAINSFLISCRCKRSPIGPAPYAHLGNGYTDLVIVKECNRFNFLQHLLKSSSYEDHFDFDFIETVRVSEFSFTPLGNENKRISTNRKFVEQFSVWNCDGEPLNYPNINCKVHRKLIRLFANGIPNTVNHNDSIRSLAGNNSSRVMHNNY